MYSRYFCWYSERFCVSRVQATERLQHYLTLSTWTKIEPRIPEESNWQTKNLVFHFLFQTPFWTGFEIKHSHFHTEAVWLHPFKIEYFNRFCDAHAICITLTFWTFGTGHFTDDQKWDVEIIRGFCVKMSKLKSVWSICCLFC